MPGYQRMCVSKFCKEMKIEHPKKQFSCVSHVYRTLFPESSPPPRVFDDNESDTKWQMAIKIFQDTDSNYRHQVNDLYQLPQWKCQ